MAIVFHWNGRDLPPELAGLPPGEYRVVPANDDASTVTEGEQLAAAYRTLAGKLAHLAEDVEDEPDWDPLEVERVRLREPAP